MTGERAGVSFRALQGAVRFRGKAVIKWRCKESQLLTQSGHALNWV
jgi:hypothetical protein